MILLMDGFPPERNGRVTLANWRTSPFNRWAFQHLRELLPTADIPNDPARVMDLPSSPIDLWPLSIESMRGDSLSFEAVLRETSTDGLVILQHGRVVFEHYANGMTVETPHMLMSVSKSMLGLLAGVLIERGELRADRPVTDIVPEMAGTAYEGATIRHLLDMRVGIEFQEDYLATKGALIAYRKATGWQPLEPGDAPSDLRSFLQTLTVSTGPHGGPVHYVSPNTDLLGWAIERATGQRYADLLSELIWKPLGAERSAYIAVDRLGAPRPAGGMCVTVRDLARVGQMIVERGARGSAQVVPEAWIADIADKGDPDAWAAGDLAEYLPGEPLRYRNQWYVYGDKAPLLFAIGVHGQTLHIERTRGIVIARVSSRVLPIDAEADALAARSVARIIQFLAASKSPT